MMHFGRSAAALGLAAMLTTTSGALAGDPRIEVGPAPGADAIALADDGMQKALAALPPYIETLLARSGVPGLAVAVVHRGKTVYAAGFGIREAGKAARITPDTVFQLASISKPLAGTVAAIQVSRGKVAWDDPAVKHLPGLALSDAYVTAHATIGDFFSHRSGLPNAAGDDLEDLGYQRAEIISRLRLVPLDQFRTSYHYANFGITIGAEAVAAAAGVDWETLSETTLYQQLGMTSTSSRHADFLTRENRAHLHALVEGKFQPLYDRDPDAQSPAGGVSSNVLDLAEWIKLLLAGGTRDGQQLIASEALLLALSPQAFSARGRAPAERSGFYGYGFNVGVTTSGRPMMSHSGAFLLGAGNNMQIVPSAGLGIVVLTNGAPIGLAEAVATQFMDIAQYGAPTREWFEGYRRAMRGLHAPAGDLAGKTPPVVPAPARPLDAYAGDYANAYFGKAALRREGNALVLTLGPKAQRTTLKHWDGDVFALAPSGENAPEGSLSSVRFTTEAGSVTGFIVQYLDDNGLATWRR